ncbi:protein SCAI [Blastocladiella britannica]|nr:protein SCAI [Blastocladiella britannica]
MAATPDAIYAEFRALDAKSKALFLDLRDLPPHVPAAVWKPFFKRTFGVFTRLWKFQQLNRVTLEREDGGGTGLKRHEVGETASKIGQLYYNLRSSETGYLLESYTFFEAIWDRGYFNGVMETRVSAVAAKCLRYYARFMIVCLLLGRWDRVQVLTVEIKRYVDTYTAELDPSDVHGWLQVVKEMLIFVKTASGSATDLISPPKPTDSLRLPARPPSDPSAAPRGSLRAAVICGCWTAQPKFADLSIDMFRMMQLLERDPRKIPGDSFDDPDVPVKVPLFQPSASSIVLHLATSQKDLSASQHMLFYFSGSGSPSPTFSSGRPGSQPSLLDLAQLGVDTKPRATSARSRRSAVFDSDDSDGGTMEVAGAKALPPPPDPEEGARFHLTDLMAFMRKPLVAIIDSPGAHAFKRIPQLYSAPFLFMLAPQHTPPLLDERLRQRNCGSLLTLFLAQPLRTVADLLCGGSSGNGGEPATDAAMAEASTSLAQWEADLGMALQSSAETPESIATMLLDDHLRRLIVRFVIARITFSHSAMIIKTTEVPSFHPDLSDALWAELQETSLAHFTKVLEHLGGQSHFR